MGLSKSYLQTRLSALEEELRGTVARCDELDKEIDSLVRDRGQATADVRRLEGKIAEVSFILSKLEEQ